METTEINGARITSEIISAIKDFQCGRCDWVIDSLDSVIDTLLDNRDQYDPTELLNQIASFRLLKLYLNELKKGN